MRSQARNFPADEALKLAQRRGREFDEQLRDKVLEIKGGDVIVWDSGQRAKEGAIGSMGGICRLDALHHAAQAVRERNVGVAKEWWNGRNCDKDNTLLMAPGSDAERAADAANGSGKGALAGAAADAEALEKLRKLMFAGEVPQSKQWMLFEPEDEYDPKAVSEDRGRFRLRDRDWDVGYSHEDGDLVAMFFVPALSPRRPVSACDRLFFRRCAGDGGTGARDTARIERRAGCNCWSDAR